MLFSGTALVLFFCSLINFKNTRVFYTCFVLLVFALVYQTYFLKDYYHQSVKTVYEYQFERTVHYKKKYGDKNVFPLFFDADNIMKKIYFEKYGTQFPCKISSDSLISNGNRVYFKNTTPFSPQDTIVSSIRLFSKFVKALNCDYVVMTSSTPLYETIVMEYFPHLIENTQTQGVYFKLFSRKNPDGHNKVKNDKVTFYSNPFNGSYTPAEIFMPAYPSVTQVIDYRNEFPYGVKIDYDKLNACEGNMLLARAIVDQSSVYQDKLELCIHVTDSTGRSYAYSSKSLGDFEPRGNNYTVMYSDQFIGTSHKNANHAVLNYYLWNRAGERHVLRSFELFLVDYWHAKWHFWD
jgi:hypothetical protein